ncbi:Coenzyme F420 hydrogenase/dehydrogenase, beta subunit C-terminal domain [Sphingobium sp.]|uniref:Coenzyme F420 hydrogenase/dehydrogenase, beta subunit C-terminal domain n=1 Tax=Sphingobium sp. TaxID=1912891 RepID=UPI002B77C643|nr:Coenzyme F420 hydrogenase/dehydrogenase, beta subunit C-terminal domain [Sphingobium sp.]HUD95313.1 Coenzyme F420 hydrogenase/dehydrogenase, beta subunit C-terminal domain [Sphingobium sp.]
MRPPPDRLVSPRDMVSSGLCTGCGGCVSLAGEAQAHLAWDADGQLKPQGERRWHRGRTESFSKCCPFSPIAPDEDIIAADRFPRARHIDPWIGRFEAAYVGHAVEPGFRDRGSSGGMVSWVAAELLRRGMVDGVAHVAPVDPTDEAFFGYSISRDEDSLRAGAKSRYYPVEMSAILREMRDVPGRYAVIAIPCFIRAVHLATRADPILRERIAFTMGLVCGHMKSRHMVESFAWQMGMGLEDVSQVDFRVKDPDRPANWYTARLDRRDGEARTKDWWHLVDGDWGSGFFQNRACDFCDDVVAETADISFGDAWVEPHSSDGRGTNVVVVRSAILHALISEGRAAAQVELKPVDAAFVRETQAAGFRQRREGLAYRLAWRRSGVQPRKRVVADRHNLPFRRKLIYRLRHGIARGSVVLFRVARRFHQPGLFILGGRSALAIYQGMTYSRGWIGRVFDRAERLMTRLR